MYEYTTIQNGQHIGRFATLNAALFYLGWPRNYRLEWAGRGFHGEPKIAIHLI